MKILFIPSYYPSKSNTVSGIFIKELAKSVSLYDDVVVLHVLNDRVNGFHTSDEIEDGVRVVRATYKDFKVPFVPHAFYFISLFYAFVRLKKNYPPDLINAHVYYPAGVVTVIIGKIFKIPTVITEHAEILDRYKKQNRVKKIKDFLGLN
ncbi:MAG TPA: hypothetical protein ENN18_10840 [Proteobacteria bacterium]|nr:hypothetical protein [Pseudomonadota bacterium]